MFLSWTRSKTEILIASDRGNLPGLSAQFASLELGTHSERQSHGRSPWLLPC